MGTIALKVLEITFDAAPPRTFGVVPVSYLGEGGGGVGVIGVGTGSGL